MHVNPTLLNLSPLVLPKRLHSRPGGVRFVRISRATCYHIIRMLCLNVRNTVLCTRQTTSKLNQRAKQDYGDAMCMPEQRQYNVHHTHIPT